MSEKYRPELNRLEIDRHDERIIEGLKESPTYKKQGSVRAEVALGGEVVETILNDGTVESINTAEEGDFVVTNPTGEKYILKPEIFHARNEKDRNKEGVYIARGYCKAIENPFEQPISMMASWGGTQNGAEDCIVADVYDVEANEAAGEPYIIGREQFEETYKLVSE